MSADPVWLSEAETAAILGITVATLRSWGRRGRGPRGRHMGGVTQYITAEVLAWAVRGRQGGVDSGGNGRSR